MPADLHSLLARFSANSPADDKALEQFEKRSELALPTSYKKFLKCTNGGDGFIGKNRYVILWRLEELLELNESYRIYEFARGLFLFGSNGGGEAFAFDMRSDQKLIVSMPYIGMAIDSVHPICDDFEVFLSGDF